MRYKLPKQFPLIQVINKFCLRKSSLSIWRGNWQMENVKVKNICLPTPPSYTLCVSLMPANINPIHQGQILMPDSQMRTDCSLAH